MISQTEVAWLQTNYPNLKVNPERTEVSGELIFAAAYDTASDTFTPLTLPGQMADGVIIRSSYDIHISKNKDASALPLLRIAGNKIKICPDRHFYNSGYACLCGTVEQVNFIATDYSFQEYLERLVYPFLYEQSFYDKYHKWPWGEYAHNEAGILQSYYYAGKTVEHAEECLKKLRRQKKWARLSAILRGHRMTESNPCFCSDNKPIAKCHTDVWFGILKLRRDIKTFGISVEEKTAASSEPINDTQSLKTVQSLTPITARPTSK